MSTITNFETAMNARTPAIVSKAPNMGTTIFTVMSGLAAEAGAVNLGQGFPDFECDPALVNAVTQAMQDGLNQYPLMPGAMPLREAVSKKIESLYGYHYDAQTEITITAGATQALITIMLAVVHPGDEVIVSGRLKMESWLNKEGQKHSKICITAESVGLHNGRRENTKPVETFENEQEIPF